MKLYKISQTVNNDYDTYSDAVVAAPDEATAKTIHPGNYQEIKPLYEPVLPGKPTGLYGAYGVWALYEDIQVEEIGLAKDPDFIGVICASFHAG